MIDKLDLNADFYRISRKKKKMAKDKLLQKSREFSTKPLCERKGTSIDHQKAVLCFERTETMSGS